LHPRSSAVERCIMECRDCHGVCLEASNYCLDMGGRHSETGHMTLMRDCAQICKVSEDFMLRDSDYAVRICRECADICDKCAESCESFENDQVMKKCAESCRRCAEACREMSSM